MAVSDIFLLLDGSDEAKAKRTGLWQYPVSYTHLDVYKRQVRLSLAADDLFILPPKWCFVKPYFLEAFELSELGSPRSFSEQTGTFQRLLVLFKGFLLRL